MTLVRQAAGGSDDQPSHSGWRGSPAAVAQPGLTVAWRQENSSAHHAIATALARCYAADSAQIAGQIGMQATADLITSHRLWSDWLGSGRVRKFAMVAEKR